MIDTPNHTKVRTERSLPDGSKVIDSHSVHTALSSVKQEIQQHVKTTRETLALDLIKCSEIIANGQTDELSLRITIDKTTGDPSLITKTWTVHKEYYGKGS